MLSKNMKECVPKRRETLTSTDIHSTGKKTMFKKVVMLLAPFVLAQIGSFLTDSAVYAAEWSGWDKCYFTTGFGADYTPWRALIDVRSSDKAARVLQIEYGGERNNDERITLVKLQQSRFIKNDFQKIGDPVTFNSNNQTAWKSPTMSYLPFMSATFTPRKVLLTLTRADGGDKRVCTSEKWF
jgi:hypothetical protein